MPCCRRGCCLGSLCNNWLENDMIASFAHNFIFIKTRKTAGSSIELALGRLCGDDDIITTLGFDEPIRWEHGWRGAQNFSQSARLARKYLAISNRRDAAQLVKLQRKIRKRGGFHPHMGARRLVKQLDAAFWSRAYKWTVERHPYEKAVSLAYFKIWRQSLSPGSFQETLNNLIANNRIDDRFRYTIDGRLAVDEIIKFEELPVAFPRLIAKLGLTFDGELPRAKSTQRADRRPARDVLSQKQKDAIFTSCRATFEMFGYER